MKIYKPRKAHDRFLQTDTAVLNVTGGFDFFNVPGSSYKSARIVLVPGADDLAEWQGLDDYIPSFLNRGPRRQ